MGLQLLQGLECTAQVLGGWQVVLTLVQLPNRPYEWWIVMRRHSRFFSQVDAVGNFSPGNFCNMVDVTVSRSGMLVLSEIAFGRGGVVFKRSAMVFISCIFLLVTVFSTVSMFANRAKFQTGTSASLYDLT